MVTSCTDLVAAAAGAAGTGLHAYRQRPSKCCELRDVGQMLLKQAGTTADAATATQGSIIREVLTILQREVSEVSESPNFMLAALCPA